MYLIYDIQVNTSLNVDLGTNKPSKWHKMAIISVRDFAKAKYLKSLLLAHFSIFFPEIYQDTPETLFLPYVTYTFFIKKFAR